MITKEEIDRVAAELSVNTSNVQRDYVFGWLLFGIFRYCELGTRLVLKGGNCLRKAYFPFGRFSSDLDFSCPSRLEHHYVTEELNNACDIVSSHSGVVFDTLRTVTRDKRNVDDKLQILESRVYFTDFYGQKNWMDISIRVDITQFDRLYLPIQERQLIHAYSDHDICRATIRCVKLEEQIAAKMKCLLQRRHVADLFDLVATTFVRPHFEVNRREIVSTFLKKTIFERGPGIAKSLLLDLPLEVFRSLWSKYIVCPMKSLISFDAAVSSFRILIGELFHSVPATESQVAFFPSKFRNPIMEAGHSLTLLRVTYGGIERLVEPYSLTYKVRKDGIGREYFYVYDRTGGQSGPGIKALVASGIERIDNTREEFDPQFPVELRKAGEHSGSPHFSTAGGRRSPFGQSPKRRQARVRTNKFVIQCSVCGKRFYRKTTSTKLNKHKDKYGNQCYGRIGYRV